MLFLLGRSLPPMGVEGIQRGGLPVDVDEAGVEWKGGIVDIEGPGEETGTPWR